MKDSAWLLLTAALAGGLIFTVHKTLEDRVIEAGDSAPSFSIKAEDGKTYSEKDFGGKVLVLNFWATWCPPCVEETPSMIAMSEELKKDGVIVLGVSIDKNLDAYKRFTKRFQMTYATANDREARISASFGTFKYPETYVIKDGKVVEKIISMPEGSWMDPALLARLRKFAS